MTTAQSGKLWMGPGTLEIPLELFALNRRRLVERVLPKSPGNAVIVLQGGNEVPFYDTDTTYNVFRQESYFMWAFGAIEPGCFGAIEVATGRTHLFVPHFPKSYAIWMGPLHSLQDFSNKYGIPEVHYADEIASVLKKLDPTVLLTLKGTNSDSGLTAQEAVFDGIDKFKVNNTILFDEIADLRVFKTDEEIAVMKYVVETSSTAHRKVMRMAKAGKSEYQCESEFLHHCYGVGGCRHVSYTCICASHTNAAILHYGHAAAPNNRFIKDGELCLFDMGANYFGYAADITCTFPVSGKFTADQKLIYEAVLTANLAVFKAAKPGVGWPDMHVLANRTLLEELKKGGLLKGDVDAMVTAGLGAIFQPHGLGHLLGLDVHDVGGYITGQPPRRQEPRGIEKLRTNRILQDRMVLTIEPGCYFVDILLDEALADPVQSQFLVPDVIKRFRNFGGVRIEDDVLITKNGAVNLTKVPRTVVSSWLLLNMAKRLSSSQSNTLLNYFQSPKAKNSKEIKPENGVVKSDVPNGNETESPVQVRKRKKISIIDSDSEEENSVPIKPTPKKKKNQKRVASDSDEDSSDNSGKPGNKKPLLKQFAFEKTTDDSSKSKGEPVSVKAAPVVGDINSNWLHNRLDFLHPDKICDAKKLRPDHPDYDSRTLYIPKSFLDKQTPAMRQWWILKSAHMDSVLFFKVGKFYELYHMDAVVGVTQLGFSYMKGEFAHSGFPESAYHKMANALIEKGFKVARTEQTETPEMMAERCKKQGKTTKYDKVVNREICQITTKATCVYSPQLPEAMHSLPCYMYAITEKDVTSQQRKFGVCFIDTSLGVFHMCEFEDDKHCSKLLVCLSEYPPGLILTERKKLSPKLKSVLNTLYKDIRKDTLAPDSQFYSASSTIEKLMNGNYFKDKDNQLSLPQFIKDITNGYNPKPEYEMAIKALGACLWYLEDSKLDIQVVSMGKFEMYHPLDMNVKETLQRSSMILDSVTMINLNLLGEQGSLQKTVDYCQTAFGKRLLLQWICRPLCNVKQIKERQEAVEELFKNSSLLKEAQDYLKKLPDLERQLAKIHTYGNRFFASDHPDSRAVFYEAATYSKRRINDLLKTLQGFEVAQNIHPLFKGCTSPLLRRITQFSPDGMYVDLTDLLDFFKTAFDQEQAQKEGKIIPKSGVDENYDQAEENIQEVKNQLEEYLAELQKIFGCKVTYFGSDKKRFQIDIPESHTKKVTSEYQLEGTKKGSKPSKRYSTSRSRQLLADMIKAEHERTKIVQDLNRRIFEKFSQKRQQWEQAIECITLLDVLCSLAEYARSFSQEMCLPEIESIADSNKIIIQNGRHPCATNVDSFVPNDTKMGVDDYANILLITGPNMGGKSTLMRQVAIICIMAHMGSYVPASSCRLNLIDRIFTRLGAHDDIIQGQSTFLLELTEASAILQHATPYSLVLLDELGRGTSTHDGNAIATAYVQKLTSINCRTLFSTHYHSLVDHFETRSDVQLGHMACMVENDEDPTEESVTFLYKMARGRCPKSFGFNVARLAGLKHCIVARGREISKELEKEAKNRQFIRDLFTTRDLSSIKTLLSSLKI